MEEASQLDYDDDSTIHVGHPSDPDSADVDLYADLAGATAVSDTQESYLELQQRADAATTKNKKLSRHVELLQKKNDILTKQNTALKKNISCLYKTAKDEIERKNADLLRLRADCDRLTIAMHRLTHPPAPCDLLE
eukprot:m.207381 g.207381  ORF g.207381 m.207381 type:complete len:136 (-) comp23723_c0_seq1:101-508(-)